MFAVTRSDVEAVASALRNPLTDPNMIDWVSNGMTPLALAAARGHAQVTKLLLADERVDPNMVSGGGRTGRALTALMRAARKGRLPVVKLLMADQRVNPNIASGDDGS